MSFLTPAFLFGALAAMVPVLLHFLRRERLPRVPFSDLRLLRDERIDHARRRRLREFLLLALRATALVLLALAFARPFVADRPAPGGPATVVLVDTSFSVSAPGQADEARALARAAIDAAPAGQLVGVVAFDDEARVAAGLTLDRRAARAAVDGLSPRPRGTRYREGLAAAAALLGDRPGRVVVVTDLQAGGWDDGGSGGGEPAGATGLPPGGGGGVGPGSVGGPRSAGGGDLSPGGPGGGGEVLSPVGATGLPPGGRGDGGGLSPDGTSAGFVNGGRGDGGGLSPGGTSAGFVNGGREDTGGGLSPHIAVETRRVAPPVGNLAVVGIDRESAHTAVRLRRWGSVAGETRLTLEVDGVVLHDRTRRVEPGASTVRLPVTLPDAGVATVAVSDPAGYPADDRRYRRLDAADAARVLLVTDAGVPEVYLERALAAVGPARVAVATATTIDLAVSGRPNRTASRGGADPTAAADPGRRSDLSAQAGVVVLAGARGLGRAGRERLAAFVRAGGGLLAVGGPATAAAARAGLLGGEPGAEASRVPPASEDASTAVDGAEPGAEAVPVPPPASEDASTAVDGAEPDPEAAPVSPSSEDASTAVDGAEPGAEAAPVPTARITLRQRSHPEPVAAVPTDRRHPVVRALGELAGRLGEARFEATAAIDASAGAVVLSFTDGAPALVDRPVGAGRVLVFASDLRNEGNDLPRLPVFVPFLHEVVRHLASAPAGPREFVVGAAPPGAPDEPGPARLPGPAGPVVLNVDTRESVFAPLTDEAFRASVERLARRSDSPAASSAGGPSPPPARSRRTADSPAASSSGGRARMVPENAASSAGRDAPSAEREAVPAEETEQGLWRYLLMAAALVLVAEGLLAARTP